MFELRFIIRIIRATSACAKQPEIEKKPVSAMDKSSASSSSVRKHFEKNKGAGTVTCKLCQNRLKWNGSTTSSFGTTSKGNTPLRLQVKLCCQHGAPIYTVAYTYFSFRLWWAKAWKLLWFIHARIIREYSTIRAAGRELFDSHKMSIRFTPRWNLALFSGSRKESSRTKAWSTTTEGGARQIYRAVELRKPGRKHHPHSHTERRDVRNRGRVASNQKQIATDRLISNDIGPFRSFPRAQAYSLTRYDAPKTNRLLR